MMNIILRKARSRIIRAQQLPIVVDEYPRHPGNGSGSATLSARLEYQNLNGVM
jgi:hypothetical protein